jgi:hypothetical protein
VDTYRSHSLVQTHLRERFRPSAYDASRSRVGPATQNGLEAPTPILYVFSIFLQLGVCPTATTGRMGRINAAVSALSLVLTLFQNRVCLMELTKTEKHRGSFV